MQVNLTPQQNPGKNSEGMSNIRYLCQRCGNCCRWPGFVRVDTKEIDAMAEFLGHTPNEFIERHTSLRPSRTGLMLKSRPDGSCIFLEGVNTCAVQSVKPQQCRDFPNRWNFPGWRDLCEAIEDSSVPMGRDITTHDVSR